MDTVAEIKAKNKDEIRYFRASATVRQAIECIEALKCKLEELEDTAGAKETITDVMLQDTLDIANAMYAYIHEALTIDLPKE